MIARLTPRALRTRWAVDKLRRAASRYECTAPPQPVLAMGLVFASPLGLAAGFDRHGRLLAHGDRLGLGAVEIGSRWTLAAGPSTPMGASMGSRSHGVRCGLSLVKPPGLEWSQAEAGVLNALATWHRSADYLTLNPGRGCPSPRHFIDLLAAVAQARDVLPRQHRLALVAKLPAAWLEAPGGVELARCCVAAGADGLLLSAEGAPASACARLQALAAALGPAVCLISVGGIASLREARARLRAGAQLVQVHRALLRGGPPTLRLLCRIAHCGSVAAGGVGWSGDAVRGGGAGCCCGGVQRTA